MLKKEKKRKGGWQHLKKKGGHHRVLSTRTCDIQRIVTKTTHQIQNKETIKSNQTTYTCLKRMPP